MNIPFVDLKAQYQSIKKEIMAAIEKWPVKFRRPAKEILKFQDAELLYTDNKDSLNLI